MRAGAIVVLALAGCDAAFGLRGVPDAPVQHDGPVLHLPMDTMASCATPDVVTGQLAGCDCAHCPIATTGVHDGALAFDGTDRLEMPGGNGLETVDAFTIAAFVLPQGTDLTCPANKLAGTVENSWQLCMTGAELMFITSRVGNPADLLSASVALTADWHHIAVRYDGTHKSIVLDGTEVASHDVAERPVFDGGPIELGTDVDSGVDVQPFTGALDDVRIYGRALGDAELVGLAQHAP